MRLVWSKKNNYIYSAKYCLLRERDKKEVYTSQKTDPMNQNKQNKYVTCFKTVPTNNLEHYHVLQHYHKNVLFVFLVLTKSNL